MNLGSYLSVPVFLNFITAANVMAAIGGLLYVASISMKTVIPLRIVGIGIAVCFLLSGIFSHSFSAIFLYSLLLPLNTFRLYQMLELIKKVRAAASSDLTMDWLQPFMKKRGCRGRDPRRAWCRLGRLGTGEEAAILHYRQCMPRMP